MTGKMQIRNPDGGWIDMLGGGAEAPDVSEQIEEHNADQNAHPYIRELVAEVEKRLNALADSDDTTLDQLSEIVAYIKSNKSLIDAITTGKVSVGDIVNNLTTNAAGKVLSAAQGVVLRTMIEAITVPTALSQLTSDAAHRTVTDSEKAAWDGKLDADKLPEAVEGALAQAKASGEFDGADGQDGYTPVKGKDYFDGKDGQDGAPGANGSNGKDGVSATHSWNGTVLTVTSASGTSSADLKGQKGDKGDPGKDSPADAVRYGEQSLTDEQMAQVRSNIGAASAEAVGEISEDLESYTGKKILFMGDSMMIQSQPTHGWIGLFNEIIKPSAFVNTAVSGATYTETSLTVYDGNPVSTNQVNNVIGNQIEKIARGKDTSNPNYSKVADYEVFDIIIIAAGINDYSIKTDEPDIEDSFTTDSAVAELSALDRKIFASAFRYNIERIQKLYPAAKIFVCTPTQVALGARTYKSVKEKRNHIIALCERMSIAYIDTFMCGIYSVNEVNNGAGLYLKDGVHPNDAGKAVIANYNAREIIKYFISNAVPVPVPEIIYTNLVPTSINADGAVFNGTGYQDNARINSSGVISTSAAQATTATGFIKVSGGDVVRIKGGPFTNAINGTNSNAIGVYDGSKSHLGTTTAGGYAYGIFGDTYGDYKFSSVLEEKTGVFKWVVPPTASGVEWIRLSCLGDGNIAPGADLIVTVNQEIT